MQNSASCISGEPDFLPTTAGSLCESPHLGCFHGVSGTRKLAGAFPALFADSKRATVCVQRKGRAGVGAAQGSALRGIQTL